MGTILGFFVFHPGLSPLADSLGFEACMALMIAAFGGGIALFLLITIYGRRYNQTIDNRIADRCRRAEESSGCNFTYVATFTHPCKPKQVRTYRAIHISPASVSANAIHGQVQALRGGYGASIPIATASCACVPVASTFVQPTSVVAVSHASGAPQPVSAPQTIAVAVPKGSKPGDCITVRAPDGQMMAATIPEGVAPGSTFNVQTPPPQHHQAIVVDAVPIP